MTRLKWSLILNNSEGRIAVAFALTIFFFLGACSRFSTPSDKDVKDLFHLCLKYPMPSDAVIVKSLESYGGINGDGSIVAEVTLNPRDLVHVQSAMQKMQVISSGKISSYAPEFRDFFPRNLDLEVSVSEKPAIVRCGLDLKNGRVFFVSTTM